MQIICTSLQTEKSTPVTHHSVFTDRMPFLQPNQQHQSTEGKKINASKTYSPRVRQAAQAK